jgi:hypothetical protein
VFGLNTVTIQYSVTSGYAQTSVSFMSNLTNNITQTIETVDVPLLIGDFPYHYGDDQEGVVLDQQQREPITMQRLFSQQPQETRVDPRFRAPTVIHKAIVSTEEDILFVYVKRRLDTVLSTVNSILINREGGQLNMQFPSGRTPLYSYNRVPLEGADAVTSGGHSYKLKSFLSIPAIVEAVPIMVSNCMAWVKDDDVDMWFSYNPTSLSNTQKSSSVIAADSERDPSQSPDIDMKIRGTVYMYTKA